MTDSRLRSPPTSPQGWRAPLAVNPGPLRSVLGCDGGAHDARPVASRSDGERCLDTNMTKLITAEQRAQMLENGLAAQRGDGGDQYPVVKLFTPDAGATWLLTELDPDDEDVAFGLCDLGLGFPELGRVRLSELASIRGPNGLPIERDMYFRPMRTLSAYVELARAHGSIID